MDNYRGWIGVDLDGTLAHYDEWRGHEHIGEPVPAMLERVKKWLDEGWEVRIFTARCSGGDYDELCIVNWLKKHGLPHLRITNEKDYDMVEFWDDRAVQVRINTGEPVGYSTRGLS